MSGQRSIRMASTRIAKLWYDDSYDNLLPKNFENIN